MATTSISTTSIPTTVARQLDLRQSDSQQLRGRRTKSPTPPVDPLREKFSVKGALLMYVGNLESYQGIDLLLESFAIALKEVPTAHLVVIGGAPDDVCAYRLKAGSRRLNHRVHFIGPRPISQLSQYLEQADIVVSPRTQGNNTPMKLYSYLDSGKALLATNLTTHTQVLNERIACIAEPRAAAFAAGMVQLIANPLLRQKLGVAAQQYIAREHTYEAFSQKLTGLYDWLQQDLAA